MNMHCKYVNFHILWPLPNKRFNANNISCVLWILWSIHKLIIYRNDLLDSLEWKRYEVLIGKAANSRPFILSRDGRGVWGDPGPQIGAFLCDGSCDGWSLHLAFVVNYHPGVVLEVDEHSVLSSEGLPLSDHHSGHYLLSEFGFTCNIQQRDTTRFHSSHLDIFNEVML